MLYANFRHDAMGAHQRHPVVHLRQRPAEPVPDPGLEWLGGAPVRPPRPAAVDSRLRGRVRGCRGRQLRQRHRHALYDCNGTAAQESAPTVRSGARQVPRRDGAGTANGTQTQLYDCNGTNAQKWTAAPTAPWSTPRFPASAGRHGPQLGERHPPPDLDLRHRRQPAVAPPRPDPASLPAQPGRRPDATVTFSGGVHLRSWRARMQAGAMNEADFARVRLVAQEPVDGLGKSTPWTVLRVGWAADDEWEHLVLPRRLDAPAAHILVELGTEGVRYRESVAPTTRSTYRKRRRSPNSRRRSRTTPWRRSPPGAARCRRPGHAHPLSARVFEWSHMWQCPGVAGSLPATRASPFAAQELSGRSRPTAPRTAGSAREGHLGDRGDADRRAGCGRR